MSPSANLSCPGNLISSFAISSAGLVICSTLANLDLICNKFIKIFRLPITSAFSLLDKVIIFNNSIQSITNGRLWAVSIICKSNLGHPDLTRPLQISGFLLAKAVNVLTTESHNSSLFNAFLNKVINDPI